MVRLLSLDVMRCVAAIAVVAIHVLGPYRLLLGEIPIDQWNFAVSLNSASRWAVPVFILITGALLLGDQREFCLRRYITSRVIKVVVPFLVWSLIYAGVTNVSLEGFDVQHFSDMLKNAPWQETYYHLGFFYYFIPLYLLAPFFQYWVKSQQWELLYVYLCLWLITSALHLYGVTSWWSVDLWLYSGYLPLGYLLFHRCPNHSVVMGLAVVAAGIAIVFTAWHVLALSANNGVYTVGRWLSYKTVNVVIVASGVFLLCRYLALRLPVISHSSIHFIARHSLAMYILHPLFLIPYIEMQLYDQQHPAWVIPVWVVLAGSGSLVMGWLIGKSPRTRWLLP